MKHVEPSPPRWTETTAGGELESAAAAMMRDIQDRSQPLTEAAVARIGVKLAGASALAPPALGASRWVLASAVGAAAILGGIVAVVALRSVRPSGNTQPPAAITMQGPTASPAPIMPLAATALPSPSAEPQPARRGTTTRPAASRRVTMEDTLAAESQLVGSAVAALKRGAPRDALALLEQYRVAFPRGTLAPEATVARLDALLASGDKPGALALLDRLALRQLPRHDELQLIRGELRASAGHCATALQDFDAVIARATAGSQALERARYGRVACAGRSADTGKTP